MALTLTKAMTKAYNLKGLKTMRLKVMINALKDRVKKIASFSKSLIVERDIKCRLLFVFYFILVTAELNARH